MARPGSSSKRADLSEYGVIRTSEGYYSHPKLCCVNCKSHGKTHCLFKSCDFDRESLSLRFPKCIGCHSGVLCTAVQYERQEGCSEGVMGGIFDILEVVSVEEIARRLDIKWGSKDSTVRATYRFYKPKREGGPLERRMVKEDQEDAELLIGNSMDSGLAAEDRGKTQNYDDTVALGLSSHMPPTDRARNNISFLSRTIKPEGICNSRCLTKRKASSVDKGLERRVKPSTTNAGRTRILGPNAIEERPRALRAVGESEGERRKGGQFETTTAISSGATRRGADRLPHPVYSPFVRPGPSPYQVNRHRKAAPQAAARFGPQAAFETPSESISGMVVKLENENAALKVEVAANKLTKDNLILSLESSLAKEKDERSQAQSRLAIVEGERKKWEKEAQAKHAEIVILNERLALKERLGERYREIEALVKKGQ